MTPRWLTIEKLVAELGGVCSSRFETHVAAQAIEVTGAQVDEAIERATAAVTAVLRDPIEEGDATVRTAWEAIARAQDVIGRLRETIDRSRAVRARARKLQDEAYRLRRALPSHAGGERRGRRTTDHH